jgi:hypothetical protein
VVFLEVLIDIRDVLSAMQKLIPSVQDPRERATS